MSITNAIIQHTIEERKQRYDNVSTLLNISFEFLKKVKDTEYRLIGGHAVKAWINPNIERFLNEEHKDKANYLVTLDIDVEVKGGNKDAENFAKRIIDYLKKSQMGKEIRNYIVFRDELQIQKNIYVYQIGIEDTNETKWLIDVHAEEVLNKQNTVIINGINYPNLKELIRQLGLAIDQDDDGGKKTKRAGRYFFLNKILNEIKYLNPEVYKLLLEDCEKNGKENMTGYNLSCKEIKNYVYPEEKNTPSVEENDLIKSATSILQEEFNSGFIDDNVDDVMKSILSFNDKRFTKEIVNEKFADSVLKLLRENKITNLNIFSFR